MVGSGENRRKKRSKSVNEKERAVGNGKLIITQNDGVVGIEELKVYIMGRDYRLWITMWIKC